jgi:hypothetical protein
MPKLERDFQRETKYKLKVIFPGCIVKRNSTDDIQGFPDITVFYQGRFAMLEFKRSESASKRPNQEYWIEQIRGIGGFADFIYPENEQEIFDELKEFFAN